MESEQSTTSSTTSELSEDDFSPFDDTNDDDNNASYNSNSSIELNHLESQNHSNKDDGSSTGEDSSALDLLLKLDKCHSVCGLVLFCGPLDDALMTALTDPRPLILLLHNDKSVATNIFYDKVLRSHMIRDYLAEKFIVWGWDRTDDNNDDQFENMLKSQIGDQITAYIMRVAVDSYPLLLCITLQHGQLQIISKIRGTMSCNEVYQELLNAHDKFNRRIETFNMPEDSSLVFNEFLTILLEDSAEYDEIANKLAIAHRPILCIYNIDVPHWLKDYKQQKKIIDARIGHEQTEHLLFHGCTPSAADSIIQHRFDHELIGLHGASYGHGFYFTSCSSTSQDYAKADPPLNGRAILICRVIVGETCIGNSSMRKCPDGYDSTADGLHTTYVVYSNEQILPKYLVIYE
ncbi:unnamed protein product [Adineta steineri]|uniref:Poly [ADP-ribose] polymerase n=1 Tax=Adineta steineri TaxID=433720 RepID=A0A818HJK2_9BILA|nr:unnamed protein product [Adineta steineri]CAF3509622.1 unnamed protein product [Adineta steineri]